MRSLICLAAVALAFLLLAGCHRDKFDWEQHEDFMLSQSEEQLEDGSVRMSFVSMVNAPADKLFSALSDVEHHAEFIEDVSESKLISSEGDRKKVVDITNRVLGRPNQAKIEWTINPETRTIAFKTIESRFTDNSAEYKIEPSPDGKRARVTTVYYLRDKGGHPFPLHLLRMAIRDSYVASVSGVKRRALGPKAVVGP
jgi:ribosome-associated toxin RatA of RatAB toxin-antitoxin module